MQRHTRIYLQAYGYSTEYQDELVPCELKVDGCQRRVVDVHHIDPRGRGGDPNGDKDRIENLMGLCRKCHDQCTANKISKEIQVAKHERAMKRRKVEYNTEQLP